MIPVLVAIPIPGFQVVEWIPVPDRIPAAGPGRIPVGGREPVVGGATVVLIQVGAPEIISS